MTQETEPKPEGRIPSLVGVIKKLVSEDPLLGLIALVVLLPVGGSIASSALTREFTDIPILIGIEVAAVLFLCVPLIITKTYKQNQKEIAQQKKVAIDTEAHRRILLENRKIKIEENKQARFNQLIDAKIQALKAQEDFILSQSERHERHVLKETARELGETINKSFTFVDQEECAKNVSQILEELAKIHIDYDKVLGAIDRIETAVGTKTVPPKEVEFTVADSVKLDETDWKALCEQKQADIEGLVQDIEGGAKNYKDLESRYGRVLDQNNKLAKELSELVESNNNLQRRVLELEKSQDAEIPDFITNTVKLEEAVIETHKAPDFSKIDEAREDTELPGPHPDPTVDLLKEALNVVDSLEEPTPSIKPFWACSNCGRENNIKQIRCPKCGTSKPLD